VIPGGKAGRNLCDPYSIFLTALENKAVFLFKIMRSFFIAFAFFCFSCNNTASNSNQLPRLQQFFGTANWEVSNGQDTSYVFFSPQTDNSFKTYEYNLSKGDSVHTEMGAIGSKDEKVHWNFFNRVLVLETINDNEARWKDSTGKDYILIKQNDSLLYLRTPDTDLRFAKTLPLSTFLVRAKYDYEHGSNLRDSSEVKPGRLIQY
jgi:hypothetical protein